MRRHSTGFRFHGNGKSFTDFLADRHVMKAADLDATLFCGISHEESNMSVKEMDETGPALSAGGHKTGFLDFHFRTRISQTGCGEIRPDLSRAIRSRGSDLKPVSLGQHRDRTRFNFGSKTRQDNHRDSEER